MWVRAVWKEGDQEEEGTIPDIWLKGDNVFWPPGVNAENALRNRLAPASNWRMFSLVKIKLRSDKRLDCENFDATTTVESDEDEEEKALRRRPKKKSFHDFVTEEDAGQTVPQGEKTSDKSSNREKLLLPIPPKKVSTDENTENQKGNPEICSGEVQPVSPATSSSKGKKIRSTSSSVRSFEKSRPSHRRNSRSSSISPPPRHSSKVHRQHSERRHTTSEERSRRGTRSPSPQRGHKRSRRSRERSLSSQSHSRRSTRSRSPYPQTHRSRISFSKSPSFPNRSSSHRSRSRSNSRFSRDSRRDDKRTTPSRPVENPQRNDSVFPLSKAKFQKRVLFLLTDIRKELSTMNRVSTVSADDDYIVTRAETLQDLHDLESSLRNVDERKSMVKTMSKVGGVNVRDNSKRILEKLMTNELMSKFNMSGNNGKQAFKSTSLIDVVKVSTMKSHPSATEQDVIQAVASCLKYAPDRRGGTGRKSKESQRD